MLANGSKIPSNFNPRAHEGHDASYEEIIKYRKISIHVPTRGTTQQVQTAAPRGGISIHVPTRGTTECLAYLLDQATISIHVPTRGTTTSSSGGSTDRYFNPRAHEGHDDGKHKRDYDQRFQSTCPRGARHPPPVGGEILLISIHVPTRGTTSTAVVNIHIFISIHVPTRGTTQEH